MGNLQWESWDAQELGRKLLGWYERNRRDLPWRRSRDPYAIWISEIMLQQTRVAVVVDRYTAFMARFPTVVSLALAPEQDVLALWSGLGYYRRARMLHQAAQFVAEQCGGALPKTAEALRALPGIGAYTAAAIASIAHGQPVAVVDGNVERVLCRMAGWDENGHQSGAALRRNIERLAAHLLDRENPSDFNQALMELGAMVCTPRSPQCLVCPWSARCKTRGEHKTTPRPRMLRREIAHALSVRMGAGPATGEGAREVLLEQRPASMTVMPGLWQLPLLQESTVASQDVRLTVRHAIMQVNYTVRIRTVFENDIETLTVKEGERLWVALHEAANMALTGLTRKVLLRAHLLPDPQPATIAVLRETDVV